MTLVQFGRPPSDGYKTTPRERDPNGRNGKGEPFWEPREFRIQTSPYALLLCEKPPQKMARKREGGDSHRRRERETQNEILTAGENGAAVSLLGKGGYMCEPLMGHGKTWDEPQM